MYRKFILLILVFALLISAVPPTKKARAENCSDLRVVFVRDSGEKWKSQDYLEFRSALEPKLQTTNLTYDFVDLDYPALGIDVETLRNSVVHIDASSSDNFKNSLDVGVDNLIKLVNYECETTKFILGGYSEGAMVISKSLNSLDANKIIYAATFSDPKIYLPEGEGNYPAACNGDQLSNYRIDVASCRAYVGLLGSKTPYQPTAYMDKLGTWCYKDDVLCSSYFNSVDHYSYVENNIYQNASEIIFDKITSYYQNKTNLLTKTDSISPRYVESNDLWLEKPVLTIKDLSEINSSEVEIKYDISGLSSGAIVILNDQIMGLASEHSIVVKNIQPDSEYNVRLVPLKKYLLGDGVDIKIQIPKPNTEIFIPKAPNTGRIGNK